MKGFDEGARIKQQLHAPAEAAATARPLAAQVAARDDGITGAGDGRGRRRRRGRRQQWRSQRTSNGALGPLRLLLSADGGGDQTRCSHGHVRWKEGFVTVLGHI